MMGTRAGAGAAQMQAGDTTNQVGGPASGRAACPRRARSGPGRRHMRARPAPPVLLPVPGGGRSGTLPPARPGRRD
jgi:hypothetical protein